jgi:hypothetical protein
MNMGRVSTGFSMSLDGFVAGPQDDVSRLFQWMMSGDIEITVSKVMGISNSRSHRKVLICFRRVINR